MELKLNRMKNMIKVLKQTWYKYHVRRSPSTKTEKKVLFVDGNCYNCYEGGLIYYIVLTEGGKYKVGWDFAEVISKDMAIWQTLIGLSIVKGLYKNKDKAEEYCDDANCGSARTINKTFFAEVLK
jgi:hypothetical protein